MPRRRPRTLPRARLVLPPLSGTQALEIVNFLDRAIAAIWRVHGNAMADRLADLHPHRRPRRAAVDPAAVSASQPANDTVAATAAVAQTSLPL